ncbi:bifunctional Tubulin-tyrosine ligase-Tubulin polyglutamylase/ATP-grasp fold [Babesia duncani]|uniref:Bifunctional Tubulin-tyrosine ligase-Tubulin polyglutamylase/ATP-grasp fold n=1 Tax=Babesia duncani TaxID=323732 RepID=A0AAD9PHK2_9APIC|nr:bifunctional Tubulin-tyrosine ligase-Tubulin polyglutamylase/ATP-grasp fold [Babesia duncani]KAK2197906.1 bifunctional Tubulin-tyrosine ligase-Tubulin polyglutamylase/ATP-grasp fold [Babesia duncani]
MDSDSSFQNSEHNGKIYKFPMQRHVSNKTNAKFRSNSCSTSHESIKQSIDGVSGDYACASSDTCNTINTKRVVDNVEEIMDIISQYPSVDNLKSNDKIINCSFNNDGKHDVNDDSSLKTLLTSRLKELEKLKIANSTKSCKYPKSVLMRFKSQSDGNIGYYKRPTVNLSNARTDKILLDSCLSRLRWKGYDNGTGGDIQWISYSINKGDLLKIIDTSNPISYSALIVNRYPNLQDVTKKRQFSELLRCNDRYKNYYKRESFSNTSSSYYPTSCVLPEEEAHVLELLDDNKPVILKPSAGSMGQGMKIFVDAKEFSGSRYLSHDYIAQEYIFEPALLGKKKFDVRIYVLLASIGSGFRAFLSKHSLVRVCTEKYEYPTRSNVSNSYIHLTNYSINRFNDGLYHRNDDITDVENNKRPLFLVLEQLENEGYNKEKIWDQMIFISESVVSAIYPQIDINRRSLGKSVGCFHILGLDVIIDIRGKAWLLEANANPSLQVNYMDGNLYQRDAVDMYVKLPLLKSTLLLVHRFSVAGSMDCNIGNDWEELDLNIPAEIVNYLHLYNHCKSSIISNGEATSGITRLEWLMFCSKNGLTKLANALACNKDQKSFSARRILEDLFNGDVKTTTCTRKEVDLLGFIKLMESLALGVFKQNISNGSPVTNGNEKIKNKNNETFGKNDWGMAHWAGSAHVSDIALVAASQKLLAYLDSYVDPM